MLEPSCVSDRSAGMSDHLLSKPELYDAAVCLLHKAGATTFEQSIHEVGGTITECLTGKRPAVSAEEYSLAVVDTAEVAVQCAKGSGSDVVALVSENSTLKFAGPLLDHIPPQYIMELCYDISKNMDISIDTKNSCLTLRGYWGHIHKAREGIHKLLLKMVQEGCLKPGHKESLKNQSKPVKSLSSFSVPESHYDMLSELSPEILSIMRRKQGDFKPGISHTPGSTVVHFTFSTSEDLCHALSTFEQEYDSLLQQLCHENVSVPAEISFDDGLTLEIEEMKSRYRDACLTWSPGNSEIIVLAPTDQLPCIKEDLLSQFETLLFKQPTTAHSEDRKKRMPLAEMSYEDAKVMNLMAQIPVQTSVVLNIGADHRIIVCNDDILMLQVEAIVNPANGWLNHGGGLAGKIDQASGGAVQQYSRDLLIKQGRTGGIEIGTAVHTEAGGKLKCHYIIHAVGPDARLIQDEETCRNLLKNACVCALEIAENLKLRSIAFPAISSGIYQMNKEVVAEVIISTLVDYKQRNCTGSVLQMVYVSVFDKETYCHFQRYAMAMQSSLSQETEV